MKDEYIDMIEQAGFHEVKVVRSTQRGPDDLEPDPDPEVIVLNSKTGVEEVKKVSELGEKTRERAMEILAATMSVDVLAIKP